MVQKLSLIVRTFFIVVFVLIGPTSTSSAGMINAASPQETVIVPAGDPIQLALATWINPDVPYQDYFDAFQMAVDDYGDIKGFSIQRNDVNAGCDQETGEIAGNSVISNTQNLGVIGPYCSSSTRGMAPMLESAGVVMISYSNTFPGLSSYGETIFNRTVVTDPEYAFWNVRVSALPTVLEWIDDFNAAYGRLPSEFAKYVYDATTLMLTRIDEVSTLDGSDNLLVDRASLASAVRATSSFMGVTGDITLETDGDRVNLLKIIVTIPAGDPIQIALTTWIEAGIPFQDYFDAFSMAVDDYGPIKGFSIQRNDFNAGCDPVTGEIAGTQVVSNTQNLGVVGPYCSGSTRGMAPQLETAGVVMISYSNTAPDLSEHGWTIFNRTVVADPEYSLWNARVSSLPSVIAWSGEFAAAYGRAPSEFAKYVYDTTMLLLTRIDEVSLLDGSDNLLVDRGSLATAVRTTSSFVGITGDITLEPDGDRLDLFKGTTILLPFIQKD